ncbi:MAG TPA: hypothetical protein VF528_11085 [Pyrinomonadaceae bacterium]|jgi:hypothetical protein
MTKHKRNAMSRGWLMVIALAAFLILLVKLYLALTSEGSADVIGFADHLAKIRKLGVGTYYVRVSFNNPFNSPPFMIHVIKAWGWLNGVTGIGFSFWLRLPGILADTGSLILAWRLLNLSPRLPHQPKLLLLLALCPTSLMVQLMGYTCWAYRATPPQLCLERDTAFYVMLLCWCSFALLLFIYRRRISGQRLAGQDLEPASH